MSHDVIVYGLDAVLIVLYGIMVYFSSSMHTGDWR